MEVGTRLLKKCRGENSPPRRMNNDQRSLYCFLFWEWQWQFAGQPEQLQPHEDFPLRLSLTIFTTANAIKARTTSPIRIEPPY